jgi:hypothetical protein
MHSNVFSPGLRDASPRKTKRHNSFSALTTEKKLCLLADHMPARLANTIPNSYQPGMCSIFWKKLNGKMPIFKLFLNYFSDSCRKQCFESQKPSFRQVKFLLSVSTHAKCVEAWFMSRVGSLGGSRVC